MITRPELFDYIIDRYTMYDLLEKLEPFICMEDFVDAMEDLINNNFTMAFGEDIEEYYG